MASHDHYRARFTSEQLHALACLRHGAVRADQPKATRAVLQLAERAGYAVWISGWRLTKDGIAAIEENAAKKLLEALSKTGDP